MVFETEGKRRETQTHEEETDKPAQRRGGVGRVRSGQSRSRFFCPVSVFRTYCHLCKLGWVCGFQLVEKHTEDAGYLNLDKIKDLLFLKGSTIHVGFIQLSEGLSKPDSLL